MDSQSEPVSRLDHAIEHVKHHVLGALKSEQTFNLVRFSRSLHEDGVSESNRHYHHQT